MRKSIYNDLVIMKSELDEILNKKMFIRNFLKKAEVPKYNKANSELAKMAEDAERFITTLKAANFKFKSNSKTEEKAIRLPASILSKRIFLLNNFGIDVPDFMYTSHDFTFRQDRIVNKFSNSLKYVPNEEELEEILKCLETIPLKARFMTDLLKIHGIKKIIIAGFLPLYLVKKSPFNECLQNPFLTAINSDFSSWLCEEIGDIIINYDINYKINNIFRFCLGFIKVANFSNSEKGFLYFEALVNGLPEYQYAVDIKLQISNKLDENKFTSDKTKKMLRLAFL